MKSLLCAAALSMLLPLSTGWGAIVVEYQTAASTTNPTLAPSSAAAEITASDFSAGSGISAATGGTFNFNDWDPTNTSFAEAVADNEFFTFGFTVTDNVIVQLSDFDIRLDRSGTGPDDFEIQVSVNGGSGTSVLSFDFMDSTNGVDFIGTSLAAIPSLVQGDSVVFTIAAFNAESTAGTFDLESIDFGGSDPRSVRVNGSITVVPEPGTLLFLGASSVLVILQRRRTER